jgi:predicted glycosyltransferase
MRPRRFLLYNQSLTGTGHFVKTHEIARALAAHHSVHLVDGGRPVPRPASVHRFESIALPRILRRDGRLASADPTRSLDAVMDGRRRMLTAAVERIRPDLLLIDQFPFFKWDLHDEIMPLIERVRAVRPEARVVCSTWELPRGTGQDLRAPSPEQVQHAFRDHFDGLLVHADPRVIALQEFIPWTERIAVPIAYTGYVSEKPPPEGARERSPEVRGAVVVSTGGASLPTLLRDSAAAWQRLRARAATGERTMVAFLPPFASGEPLAEWPVPVGGGDVRVEPFAQDFLCWLRAADLSISQAGYNTCTNVLETGVRAILVPNPATLDQVARARRLAELGLARTLDPAEADPERLAAAIVEMLAAPPPRHDLDLEGADETRRRLEELANGLEWR